MIDSQTSAVSKWTMGRNRMKTANLELDMAPVSLLQEFLVTPDT